MLHLAQQATLETRERQARTPQSVRAADRLAQRGRPGSRRPSGGGCHGARRPSPLGQDQPDHRRGLGRCGGRSGAYGDGGAPLHLADLACAGRSTTPNPRRQHHHRQARAAGRPARRRSAQHQIDTAHQHRRRHRGTGAAAAVRRLIGLHRRRCRAVHLCPNPRRRAAARRHRGPHRWTHRRRGRGRPGAAGVGSQRGSPGRRAGRSGPIHGHLRCPAAAGDRPSRHRKNDRTTRAHTGLAGGRRPGARASSVRRRGCTAPRPHRCAQPTHSPNSPGPSNT